MKLINGIALTLVIIGGLNWGLFAVANMDLVALLFGAGTALAKTVYVVVGIAAIYSLTFFRLVASDSAIPRTVTHIPPAQPFR